MNGNSEISYRTGALKLKSLDHVNTSYSQALLLFSHFKEYLQVSEVTTTVSLAGHFYLSNNE